MTLAEAASALQRYQDHRMHPGSFLEAVLSNDLQGAISYADHESLEQLPHIARHVFSRMSSGLCGSREKFRAHLEFQPGTLPS
jgi:hypothetical protein